MAKHRHDLVTAFTVAVLAVPAAAQPPVPFTEEAVARGVDYSFAGTAGTQTHGRGVAFADLDRDGDADLIALGGLGGLIGLYENLDDGTFAERGAMAGLAAAGDASAITAADFDGDGDLDLYISCWLVRNILLRNDGSFVFTDVTETAGVGDEGAGVGCAWADYDGDGWLDLYVANRSHLADSVLPNRLYRNLGDGTFVDVATTLGVDDGVNPSFQPVFFDMDRDGDQDLYISTDRGYAEGRQNRLFENIGGAFLDVTKSSQTAAGIDGMGLAVGDFDRNGLLDLYCTNTPPGNVMFLNFGDGLFGDASTSTGTQSFAIGWGAAMLDYDCDGWLELYVCNMGFAGDNRLYDYDGIAPATDIAVDLQVDDGHVSYGLATADIDLDGDVDVLVQDTDRLRLFVNHEGARRHWVRLDVAAPAPNRFGIGTTVDLRIGSVWQTRQVAAGGSYKSQHELVVHAGLGEAPIVAEIVIAFPCGARRTVTGYPADATWTMVHPDLLLDGDGDGDVDLDDVQRFGDCTGPVTPGCETMDPDGDGLVGPHDIPLLLAAYGGPIHDCNGNGTADLQEILGGVASDANANWIPDTCESTGDVDGNGAVDVDDLLVVIASWGVCPPDAACYGDADGSGSIDVDDLVAVVLNWTSSPP